MAKYLVTNVRFGVLHLPSFGPVQRCKQDLILSFTSYTSPVGRFCVDMAHDPHIFPCRHCTPQTSKFKPQAVMAVHPGSRTDHDCTPRCSHAIYPHMHTRLTKSSSCVHPEQQVHICSSRCHLDHRARTRPPGRPTTSTCFTCKMVHSFSLCVLACDSLLGDGTISALDEERNCCFDLCVVKLLKIAIGYVVDLVE